MRSLILVGCICLAALSCKKSGSSGGGAAPAPPPPSPPLFIEGTYDISDSTTSFNCVNPADDGSGVCTGEIEITQTGDEAVAFIYIDLPCGSIVSSMSGMVDGDVWVFHGEDSGSAVIDGEAIFDGVGGFTATYDASDIWCQYSGTVTGLIQP